MLYNYINLEKYTIVNEDWCEINSVKSYEVEDSKKTIITSYIENAINEEPFFIIDLGEVIKAYKRWQTLLPRIKPFYAVKCNPDRLLVETLVKLDCNFDCASEIEMKLILEMTNDPTRIIYANPCKMSSQISYAQMNDIDMMTFDCEEELSKIKLYHPTSKLILRLAVDDSNSLCQFNKKYGCKIEEVEGLLKLAKSLDLNIIGFSFHVGSNCSSSENFYGAIQLCKQSVIIAESVELSISIIDIGGGFCPNEIFDNVTKRINQAINDFFSDEKYKDIQFIAEPGRYFAQNSHTLVLHVIGKKVVNEPEKKMIYYLNDGIYGSFNCIIFDHVVPIIVPFNKKEGTLYKSLIFGPTCDSMDLISEDVLLSELYIGDWVYVEDFGAYTSSASSSFNGFKTTLKKYICRS